MDNFVADSHSEGEIVKWWKLAGDAIAGREWWRAGMLALSLAKDLFYHHAHEQSRAMRSEEAAR